MLEKRTANVIHFIETEKYLQIFFVKKLFFNLETIFNCWISASE